MTEPHDEEQYSFIEFVDEHWILFIFGTFFVMTMFIPLLANPSFSPYIIWAVIAVLGLAACLVLFLHFTCKKEAK